MILRRPVSAVVAAVLAAAMAAPRAAAQAASPPATAGQDQRPPSGTRSPDGAGLPPVSLDRIRRGLEREPALHLPEPQGPVFSVSVEGRLPRFADFVGEESLSHGAAPATSVTHREYLAMVTPPEAQSFGSFTPGELAQVAATSAAFALGTQALVRGIKDAIRSRREAEARREVEAVVAELERRRREQEKAKREEHP